MSDINDLIQHALDQDYNKASAVFGDLMGEKIGDALEQEKINIANRIYNGGEPELEPEETDLELEDDEEIDLTDEEIDEIDVEEDDES
jgi:hypothetical protein